MKRLLSIPRAVLSALLRHPRLILEFAVVILGALIWFAGPLVGLTSVEARVQLIVVLSMLRFLTYMVGHVVSNRRAAHLETSLNRQGQEHVASARPDHRHQVVVAREQFEKGVAALKESKMGQGIHGKAALYALPWYMFIGPPGSGKSTALRHSGLQFPYLGGSEKGLQGVGGTRNCDWWFTNDAVLLDTAGRYISQDEDQDEWLAFLDLLKQYRKEKPINGVLAAISIVKLFEATDDQLEVDAKKIRNRIDELIKRLGIVFPVYLIFTKCDLVQGFIESFEDLNRAERERVWGCTFSKTGWAQISPQARFKEELTELLGALQARRLTRLANVRGPHKINIFGFPLQLASGQDKLARFVEVLFQNNPYQENPLFRGFYFTSGTQQGTPIDRILGAVGRASGLSDVMVSSLSTPEVKSYFLKQLFTDVIFPDQTLAGPSSVAYRQRGYFRVATFIVAVLTVVLSVTALALSFVGNKRLIDQTRSAALITPDPSLVDVAGVEHNTEFLNRLGRQFDQLRSYEEEGVPLRFWGLYRGSQLAESVRALYLKHFYTIALVPTMRDMEEQLVHFLTNAEAATEQHSDYYYGLLKTYMMLGDPVHVQPQYLQRSWGDLWKSRLQRLYKDQPVPEWVDSKGKEQIRVYSTHLARQEAPNLVLNRRLIRESQMKLRQIPTLDRMYALVSRQAGAAINPYTLEVASGGTQVTLLSDYTIPGTFTYEAWRGPFQKTLASTLDDLGQEGWVIGEPEAKRTDLEHGVKKRYFDEYVRHWQMFVRSLRVRPAATPANTEEALAALSQPDSSLYQIFQSIDRNTVPPETLTPFQGPAGGLIDKVKKGLGMEAVPELAADVVAKFGTANDFSTSVSPHFKSIHYLVSVPKDSKEEPPLTRYLSDLRKVHQSLKPILRPETTGPDTRVLAKSIVQGEPNDILQAFKTTDGLLQSLDQETQEAILPLLYEPWVMAMRGVMERAKSEIGRRWQSEVSLVCQRNIEPRYPFQAVGDDAAVSDVVEFFHPQNGILWRMYQAELKPFVEELTDRWIPKTWHGVGMTLSPEFLNTLQQARLVTDSLFSGTSEIGVVFEMYPHPPHGGSSRTVSEILVELGGQALRYRMEPEEWHEIKWPGPTPISGAVLKVQVGTKWLTVAGEYKDWWGFFRLLRAGRLSPGHSDQQYRFQWELQPGADRAEQPILIQYDVRARSSKNPFRPGLFEQFRCAEHL